MRASLSGPRSVGSGGSGTGGSGGGTGDGPDVASGSGSGGRTSSSPGMGPAIIRGFPGAARSAPGAGALPRPPGPGRIGVYLAGVLSPVNVTEILTRTAQWLSGLHTYQKVLLGLATAMFVTELVLRRFPRSAAYGRWKKGVEAVGAFWTAIILSLVYFLSVALVGLGLRLFGKDPLDRALDGASTWKTHEPNPLGPAAAARHQF